MKKIKFQVNDADLRFQAHCIFIQYQRIAELCKNPDFLIEQLHIHVNQIKVISALPVPKPFRLEMRELTVQLGVLCDEALLKIRTYQIALQVEQEFSLVGGVGLPPVQPSIVN